MLSIKWKNLNHDMWGSNLVIDFTCYILNSYLLFFFSFLNKKSEGQKELISLDNVHVLQFANVTDPKLFKFIFILVFSISFVLILGRQINSLLIPYWLFSFKLSKEIKYIYHTKSRDIYNINILILD